MIEKTISEIEAKVRGAESVGDERKRELLALLGKLKSEVGMLAKTHGEQADSIANFAKASHFNCDRIDFLGLLGELSHFRKDPDHCLKAGFGREAPWSPPMP